MFMLSGVMEAHLLLTTCPDMENNRSHGTVAAGEVRYLNASLATRPRDGAHFRHHSNGQLALTIFGSAL